MHFSDAQSITVSHLNCCSKRGIRDKEWPHEAWWLLGMTFKGRGGILRSSVDVQTIKRTASTALMKSRSIFVYYVRIDRNQVYRDHFELISKKQNRTANANITLQKRTLDELDNNFLEVFYSGSALFVCYAAIYWRLRWQANRYMLATSFYQASAQSHLAQLATQLNSTANQELIYWAWRRHVESTKSVLHIYISCTAVFVAWWETARLETQRTLFRKLNFFQMIIMYKYFFD